MPAIVRRQNLNEEEAPETQLYPELGFDGWKFQESSAQFRSSGLPSANSDVLEESPAVDEPQETQMYPDSCAPGHGNHLEHGNPVGHAETQKGSHENKVLMGRTFADALPPSHETPVGVNGLMDGEREPVTLLHSVLVVPFFGGRIAEFLWRAERSLVPDLAGVLVRKSALATCLARLLCASRELQLALVVGIKECRREASEAESFASLCDSVRRLCPGAWARSRSLRHFPTDQADKRFVYEFLASREEAPSKEVPTTEVPNSTVVLHTELAAYGGVQVDELETLPQTQPFGEVPETQVNESSSMQVAASEWHDDPAATQWYFPDDLGIASGRGVPTVPASWRSELPEPRTPGSPGIEVRGGLAADDAESATQLYSDFSERSAESALQHVPSSTMPPPSHSNFSNFRRLPAPAPPSHSEATRSPPQQTLARRQSLIISVPDTDKELEQGLQWSWAEGAAVADTNLAPTPAVPRLDASVCPVPAPRKRPRPQVPLFPGLEPSSSGRKAVATSAGSSSSSTSVGIGSCPSGSATTQVANAQAALEAESREEEDSLLTQCYGGPSEPALAKGFNAAAADSRGASLSTPPRGGPRSVGKGNRQLLHESATTALQTPPKEPSGAKKRPAASGAAKGVAVKKRPAAAMSQR